MYFIFEKTDHNGSKKRMIFHRLWPTSRHAFKHGWGSRFRIRFTARGLYQMR